jgi:hypothetical protein
VGQWHEWWRVSWKDDVLTILRNKDGSSSHTTID